MKRILDGRSKGSLFITYEMLYFWLLELKSKRHWRSRDEVLNLLSNWDEKTFINEKYLTEDH